MSSEFIQQLEQIIRDRFEHPTEGSYTAKLAASGTKRIAQKVGEEGVELALAAVGDDKAEIVSEAADLIYHLLVLLNQKELSLAEVATELERRHAG